MPVNDIAPVPRFSATAVVPMYTVLLPSTAEGTVPVKLPAANDVRADPEPEKPVADRTPVLGTNEILVVDIFASVLPAAVVQSG